MSADRSARLRANPAYELVLLDRLADFDRRTIEHGEADAYGALRPRQGAELAVRTVDADTALLFLTLAEPAPLPSYVRRRAGQDADRVVARLVLDGVLEIEHAGVFVSGAASAEIVLGGRSAGGSGRIGELSRAALAHAAELAALGTADEQLAVRLYDYGRRPLTAQLRRRLSGPPVDAAGGHWLEVRAGPAWRAWRARASLGDDGPGYKLYVSPAADALAAAFAAVAGTLGPASGATALKVATGPAGLCRADKLVVYFDRLDDLETAAGRLRSELDGTPAQGVPFTASAGPDGLLSWAVDPPAGEEGGTSWRWWVVRRLAEYLGSGSSATIDPAEFALERLRLTGIDTDTWIPTGGMWAAAIAGA